MADTEEIARKVEQLPEPMRAEVLHFTEYLLARADRHKDEAWSAFSLASAMRGISDDPDVEYRESDVVEPAR